MAFTLGTELAALWRALAVNEGAIQRVFGSVRAGMTPDEMQEIFVAEVRRRGIDSPVSGAAFIVGEGGVGPKLRLKRPLRADDLFGMDFQFASDGFHSDIGRYAVFGEPSADLLARHRRVLETQEMVADAIRPGEPIRVAFEKCPAGWTIEAHRVGIEIHMDPMFSSVKTDNKLDVIVPVGIVMCVEIWKGLDGGIEDQFLVTEKGLERLTTLPRQLINLMTR
jgi:Xaa-Pro aminopeptidase